MRKTNGLFRAYSEALLDLIYPPNMTCILCNSYLKGKTELGICCRCMKEISFVTENSCKKLSRPLVDQEDIEIYEDCEGTENSFHRRVAVVEYKGMIKDLIFRFKYYDATYLARNMAYMMAAVIKKKGIEGDMLIAVPLYPERERKRGYNQAHLLAKYISRNLDIEYKKGNLIRVKNTKVMHNLSRKQRRENLKNAFQVKDKQAVDGRDILLVDDIFTTGATADACSRVLMGEGAKSITVLTFARGV
ncbi:comF family protein [Anaerovirgula multivorans]|uniref:ComF family protein n=1 Tax=Anaerovirgula multivorans TaxID=312168 RepID=A0A239EXI8_9FIRM|nr:ComF family protein [Anaerovirgula multivorans]SNS49325.1 comF family protein [Anaerovirgula multivorans]